MADVKNPATGVKKLSLLAKLALLSVLEFKFTDLTATKDKDGNVIAILQLDEPIPLVRGSQEVLFNGARVPMTRKDVTEIKIHENDMNDDFEFEEGTNAGSYKGSDLILDVSKSSGQVWLRKTTFAQSGQEFGNKQKQENLGKLLNLAVAPVAPASKSTEPVDTTKVS